MAFWAVTSACNLRRRDDSLSSTPQPFVLTARDGSALRVGLSVCYDLRFPELYRPLAADLLVVPSAFTYPKGQAHWEVLLRARAIENLAAQDSSYRSPVFAQLARAELASDVALTCSAARRLSGSAYSGGYFLPQLGGPGTQSGLRPIRA